MMTFINDFLYAFAVVLTIIGIVLFAVNVGMSIVSLFHGGRVLLVVALCLALAVVVSALIALAEKH